MLPTDKMLEYTSLLLVLLVKTHLKYSVSGSGHGIYKTPKNRINFYSKLYFLLLFKADMGQLKTYNFDKIK